VLKTVFSPYSFAQMTTRSICTLAKKRAHFRQQQTEPAHLNTQRLTAERCVVVHSLSRRAAARRRRGDNAGAARDAEQALVLLRSSTSVMSGGAITADERALLAMLDGLGVSVRMPSPSPSQDTAQMIAARDGCAPKAVEAVEGRTNREMPSTHTTAADEDHLTDVIDAQRVWAGTHPHITCAPASNCCCHTRQYIFLFSGARSAAPVRMQVHCLCDAAVGRAPPAGSLAR
jgi:hypothetical protein